MSKRTGERCRADAMHGRELCYHHGGKSLVGIANPAFTTGRHSKYLPTRMLERYDVALSDPALLELRAEVSLVDARLSDLLGRVEHGESGSLWQELGATFSDFKAAQSTGDTGDMRMALVALELLISRGQSDYGAWHEIGALIEQRRKLVESERKRMVEDRQMMTAEQARTFIAFIAESVRRNVSDRSALAAISADIGLLMSRGVPAPVISGD